MAPTYKTFQDEESLLSQPPKNAWATRKAAGLGAALLLVAVLGVSTVSHVNPMFDIVSAASGGIDFDRSVKTLAPGYDFNLSLDPGCAETDMYGCSHADLAWGDSASVSAKLTTPGTPLVSTGAKVGWELTVKAGLFPIKIEGECDVCGPKSNSTKVINTLETHNRFERCPNGPQNGRGDRRGRAARRGGCAGGAGARAGCPGAAVGRRRRPGSCNRCQSSHAGRARTRPHRDAAFRGEPGPGAARPARCLVGASIAADQGTLAPLARLTF